jgi:hypothetical protein
MADKNGPPTSTDWWRECQSLRAENERLHVEIELLRQHDKFVTDLTIDQQLEIERLRAGAQG